MSGSKPSWGDMVRVWRNGQVIGMGVAVGCPIPNRVSDTYWIDTTFGPGYSLTGENQLTNVALDEVELVESCWHQKWQQRVSKRAACLFM